VKLFKIEEERAEAATRAAANRFAESPAGQARAAYERGDALFQFGGTTSDKSNEILNSICREGWELVNGSFTFVETGADTTNRFLTSSIWEDGKKTTVKGKVVGYYLFRRRPASGRTSG
jgi:hypothetical protein